MAFAGSDEKFVGEGKQSLQRCFTPHSQFSLTSPPMPRRIPRPHTPDGMPDSDCEACPRTPDGQPESDCEDDFIVHAVSGCAGGAKPVAGNNRSAAAPRESLHTSRSCHLPDTWPSNASLLARTHTAFVEIGGDQDFELDAAQADANGHKASAAHTKVCETMQAQLNAGSAQTMEGMKEEQMEAELGYALLQRQQEHEKRKQEEKEASLRKRHEEGDVEFAYKILRKLQEGESGQQKEGDLRSSTEENLCYRFGSAPLLRGEEDGNHTRGKRLWESVDPGHPSADELDLYTTAPESWRHTVAQVEIQLHAHNKEIMNQEGFKQQFGEEMASVTAPLTRMVCAHVLYHVVLEIFCTGSCFGKFADPRRQRRHKHASLHGLPLLPWTACKQPRFRKRAAPPRPRHASRERCLT